MANDAALIGTWKVVAFVREDLATGVKSDAYGARPSGYMHYLPDGRMCVIAVDGERRPPVEQASDADRARLFMGMVAYAGTYTVEDETVTHHIEVSWNQAWTGTDQVRRLRLDGNRLFLTARMRDPDDGREVEYSAEFERV